MAHPGRRPLPIRIDQVKALTVAGFDRLLERCTRLPRRKSPVIRVA
jgi:hypothetical protein